MGMPEHDSSFHESAREARRLLDAWDRLGRAHMMVGAGCSCGIGGVVVALEDFEQDIADYLQAEAERLDRSDVLECLEEVAREGELWSISKLLLSLAQAHPANFQLGKSGASAFLLERLGRTLQSFEKLHGST
jgi:hypothetical protein